MTRTLFSGGRGNVVSARWKPVQGFILAVGMALLTAFWPWRNGWLALLGLIISCTPLSPLLAGWLAGSREILVGLVWSATATLTVAAANYEFYRAHNGLALWWEGLWCYAVVMLFLSGQSLCASVPLAIIRRASHTKRCT
jgi:hypothetical protein